MENILNSKGSMTANGKTVGLNYLETYEDATHNLLKGPWAEAVPYCRVFSFCQDDFNQYEDLVELGYDFSSYLTTNCPPNEHAYFHILAKSGTVAGEFEIGPDCQCIAEMRYDWEKSYSEKYQKDCYSPSLPPM